VLVLYLREQLPADRWTESAVPVHENVGTKQAGFP
jgi:hypothetical protein